jgi:hypothetical protein
MRRSITTQADVVDKLTEWRDIAIQQFNYDGSSIIITILEQMVIVVRSLHEHPVDAIARHQVGGLYATNQTLHLQPHPDPGPAGGGELQADADQGRRQGDPADL